MSEVSKPSSEPRIWLGPERSYVSPLPILTDMTAEQKIAVRWAFKRWVEVALREGYEPISNWANFANEVDHSALLNRLMGGKDALPERPPTLYSYPDYDAVEKA